MKLQQPMIAFVIMKGYKRMKKRMQGNAMAIYNQGCEYSEGTYAYPQDHSKALELWHRAGKLGHSEA